MFFGKNKDLVIICAGEESAHISYTQPGRRYDVAVVCYSDHEITDEYRKVEYFVKKKGYKYPLLYSLFVDQWSYLLDKYEYFWLPDDDILASYRSINSLFAYMREFKLQLGQPSLTTKSFYSHVNVINQPNKLLRKTNFVEIMCPCFERNSLKKMISTFNESQSGWGLDFVWPKLLNYDDVGIIDAVQVTHVRACQSGDLYDKLKEGQITPKEEAKFVKQKYGIQHMPITEFETIDMPIEKNAKVKANASVWKDLYQQGRVSRKMRLSGGCTSPRMCGGKTLDLYRLMRS